MNDLVKSAYAKMVGDVNFSMMVSKASYCEVPKDHGICFLDDFLAFFCRVTHQQIIQRFDNFGVILDISTVITSETKE